VIRLRIPSRERKNGYAVAREQWEVRWEEVSTPLGLPGQRQAVCSRTSFIPLRPDLPEKKPEYRFYATDLPAHRADSDRLRSMIREHWGIENRLHHVKDRTWLEDRHWVGNKKTGAVVTILRSVASCLVRKAQLKGLNPKAHCPERIEFFNQYPKLAVELIKGGARL
jgi:hypothetical protein